MKFNVNFLRDIVSSCACVFLILEKQNKKKKKTGRINSKFDDSLAFFVSNITSTLQLWPRGNERRRESNKRNEDRVFRDYATTQ